MSSEIDCPIHQTFIQNWITKIRDETPTNIFKQFMSQNMHAVKHSGIFKIVYSDLHSERLLAIT